MKGVIFKHFESFVSENFGAELFEEVLDRLPDLRLVGPQEKRVERTGNFVLGLETLPVEW